MTAPVLLTLSQARSRLQAEPELFVVYDQNAAWVASKLMEGLPVRASQALETSEERKTLETVQALERWLLQADASRGTLLLAVGGGITTDLVGFTAAIYKRGIRYANVPTTLLAQVDAAIGGKTGVNLDGYKNMLGAFRMPEFTVLEAAFLRTLPEREWRCGLAELLKTFLIGDGEAYGQAVRFFAGAQDDISGLIAKAARIKADIVSQDPYEKGERALLNLGHTFGHAIEHEARLQGADITHGEAVAMGMVLAARLSEKRGLAAIGLSAQLKADFEVLGLPTECPYPLAVLQEAMQKDKKATGGKVKFILLEAPGRPIIQELTVNEAVDDLR